MKKKTMIALVISLCVLVALIFSVIFSKSTNQFENKMNIEYVNNNFEIDLFEEIDGTDLGLNATAEYIGSDEIVEEPKITLKVSCLYTYTDAGETYTDILNDKIILIKELSVYTGKLNFKLNQEILDGHSCSYKIDEVSGSYITN